MRVLHVFTRYLARGLEANAIHWARWQREHGMDVEFLVGRDAVVTGEFPTTRVADLIRAPSIPSDIRALMQLRDKIRRGGFEVVHTHHAKGGFLGRIAAPRGVLRVHTFHGMSFGPAYGRASPIFRAAEQLVARRTEAFIAVGEELRDRHLAAGIGTPDRFHVIRSPMDVERFAQVRRLDDPAREATRDRLGFERTAEVVLSIGALESTKRPVELLQWVAPVLMQRPETILVYLGDGPLAADVRRLAAELNVARQVRIDGWRPLIEEYLALTRVVASASVSEGLPQILIQSLAAGVRVVFTDVCGLREIKSDLLSIIPSSGSGMTTAVLESLIAPPARREPIPSLEPWSFGQVELAIERFHDTVVVPTRPAVRHK